MTVNAARAAAQESGFPPKVEPWTPGVRFFTLRPINTAPIGTSGSAFSRPARGTFGDLERNALRGPAYRRTDASLFKHFRVAGTRQLELRVEAVNVFNNVNLGNPDAEIGVPGNDNPNAGRINSTAFGNGDPQRNLQFALKFQF